MKTILQNTSNSAEATSRRQVLRGAAGFTLAIPLLPSLLPRGVQAATRQPKLVSFASSHGAVWVQDMCPAVSSLTERQQLYPTHSIGWGPLKRTVDGTNANLSRILSAPSTLLTDRIVSKMNVLLGVDIPFGIAHHTGGHLGNYARNDGNEGGGKAAQAFPRPTLDQVLGWSPKFYQSLEGVRERVIVGGYGGGNFSWNYTNPGAKTGNIQAAKDAGPSELFDRVFMGGVSTQPAGSPSRPSVVNKVINDYRSLRQSDKRLSTSDKQRLDDYIGRLDELQRKLSVKRVNPVSCQALGKPTQNASSAPKEYFGALNDVIAAAFLCSGSRIATIALGGGDGFTPGYSGDWHEQVAHSTWRSPGPMNLMVEAQRRMFEWAFLDLAQKLDVDAAGGSLLDETLVQWSSESGPESHTPLSQPVITVGGAGGYFKTGMFVDYRNVTPKSAAGSGTAFGDPPRKYAGLVHNRWLGTIAQSMGLAPADYEADGVGGYGKLNLVDGMRNLFAAQALTDLSAPMPIIRG